MDTGESIWFLAVPVIIAITINLMIVINVIRLIKRKRNLESEDRSETFLHKFSFNHNEGGNLLKKSLFNLIHFSQVAGGPNNMASTLKAARAALMLIPILGIHFLMMPIR